MRNGGITQPIVTQTFVCSGCGGSFTYRHACPAMPWRATLSPMGGGRRWDDGRYPWGWPRHV